MNLLSKADLIAHLLTAVLFILFVISISYMSYKLLVINTEIEETHVYSVIQKIRNSA